MLSLPCQIRQCVTVCQGRAVPWVVVHRYSLFRPELYWWRMVLTLRKFCEVAVALLFSSSPLFQAWCVPPLPVWSQRTLRLSQKEMRVHALYVCACHASS